MTRRARVNGFTLIELMITVTLLAILMGLAMPAFMTWIKNSTVRATAEALQNGMRLAQSEALRRSRQTVFSLTNSATPSATPAAVADGKFWSINTLGIQNETSDVGEFIEGGALGNPRNDVQITGTGSLCFSSLGRLIAVPTPGFGAACPGGPVAYEITMPGADRRLRVTVAIGGQVRMCDPNKTLSASTPDGC
ncbi:pilus assembly FimT family protein [Variovorax sp. GT1P44]|uniref:pilus assembly FimT family protein n=1 Tax=Variovorax sp. GT1P44 TaxID=3443742 RepID=UPI003F4816CE